MPSNVDKRFPFENACFIFNYKTIAVHKQTDKEHNTIINCRQRLALDIIIGTPTSL